MGQVSRKLRVLLVLPDLGYGGAEKSMAKLSVLLSDQYDIHFVVFDSIQSPPYPIGGTLHALGVGAGGNLPEKIVHFVRRIRRLRGLKRTIRPDVSISALEGADYVNLFSSIGEKLVMSIRGSKRYDQNIRGVLGFLRHRVLIPATYRRADRIVVAATGIKHELETDYNIPTQGKLERIPNHFDRVSLESAAREPVSPWEDFFLKRKVVVGVGRLSPEKGFAQFIRVFAEVRRRVPEAAFFLVGSGLEEGVIKSEIARHGLSLATDHPGSNFPDVVMAGYQQNPHKFVARAALFVLPSFTEGFPNALVEAMCLGVPVAAADCPYGPSEILQGDSTRDQAGLLLPVLASRKESTAAWSNALVSLLTDSGKRERLGQRARDQASQYTAPIAFSAWKKVIEA